ncbi:DNA mismatch repair endonuclease MutL [Acetobacter peroxydans]|jgi:DNA mismatch repair protein MutL|uniref:DNA mismatch repair protein MutL n=1 Tax=Acetobacter peroxydans TaxID=104098 RepID=A0A4Y3TPN5_9PROT|nr:DNA mismatch repair endonuclease MutL [Acetobacter peroxydans]MCH4142896.1 DNA mismatch repair endonuclease MutL [Acetobacter peroxydans]MCI1395286.1 DNA mismatch repair endonuclease MutL [Acetobacter peroxydans]MCI1410544.1 DNA mismatch repair endonuclease MutL [Acetobacter peroxydans]MCI1565555.1 DNA mismatch repair endonuclease MutL [Acetobacter peroxydans]MCI1617712.1 DNA mismatch repair endonuclease MutL [Acetobacter peroxydans]
MSADDLFAEPPSPAPSQEGIVRRLSEVVVNRIAAGEVIERPAAALKELVENAIDSGARRVDIALEGGGIDRMIVTDDGCGMNAADLALAVERHCTSKLRDDTLVQITTLGFRGEALPSIGAAARLNITSRPQGESGAWRIRVEGGRVTPPHPASGAPGTSVVVEDLFFATPARRKFLKSARVEGRHAESVVRRLALAAFDTAFRLMLDGRLVFDLPAQTLQARAAALLDAAEANGLVSVSGERDGMVLSGFICPPSVHRATAAGQFMLVNGRPVVDPLLRTAVRVAYRRVIEPGRHPVVALSLSVPQQMVDVNVHPAKTELRFADEAAVRSLVIGSIQRALEHGAGVAGVRPVLSSAIGRQARIWYPPENTAGREGTSQPYQTQAGPGALVGGVGPSAGFSAPGFAEKRLDFDAPPAARTIQSSILPASTSESRETYAEAEVPTRAGQESALQPAVEYPLGAAVAQVLDTYILAVAADGSLILVDQHAAHERLTHQRLREQFLSGRVQAQRLLVPDVVDLPPAQVESLLGATPLLERLGVEIEGFGGQSVLIRALPAMLGATDAVSLLRDLADELERDEHGAPDEMAALDGRLDAVIARMACHGSIRAGRRLSAEEMNALLRQMEATPLAGTCSHGRPTWLKLSRGDLERLFGRR